MDTNYNPYAQIVLEMKLELEEMDKKYNDLLNSFDGYIYNIYAIALFYRRNMEAFDSCDEMIDELSGQAKKLAKEYGMYPYDQKEVRYP